jgi:tRNA 2-thiouridine synthesizing protein A|tara:strand:+ start:11211 stop:11495 length:285 start_codon:yes stop_codon:yes gene_type:complete
MHTQAVAYEASKYYNSKTTIGNKMRTLDCTQLKCPLPLLKLKVALNEMIVGETICLIATDPVSASDIPKFCKKTGNLLLSMHDQPVFEFLIEKQ